MSWYRFRYNDNYLFVLPALILFLMSVFILSISISTFLFLIGMESPPKSVCQLHQYLNLLRDSFVAVD